LHVGRFTSAVIDLSLGRAVSSAGGIDELESIENAVGSVSLDTIRGDHRRNRLFGGIISRDLVSGEDGPDVLYTIFSGSRLVGGFDEAPDELRVVVNSPATIDLAAGTSASREAGPFFRPDTIAGFEHVVGGDYDDLILGDEAANVLEGGFGNDELGGRGGDDYVFGDFAGAGAISWSGATAGNDVLDGGAGDDRLDGGPLIDECTNGEAYRNCEQRDAGERAARAGAAVALPWWWNDYEVDYGNDFPVLRALLEAFR
jgi:Ca2+-binding RTX toxin-like protein